MVSRVGEDVLLWFRWGTVPDGLDEDWIGGRRNWRKERMGAIPGPTRMTGIFRSDGICIVSFMILTGTMGGKQGPGP